MKSQLGKRKVLKESEDKKLKGKYVIPSHDVQEWIDGDGYEESEFFVFDINGKKYEFEFEGNPFGLSDKYWILRTNGKEISSDKGVCQYNDSDFTNFSDFQKASDGKINENDDLEFDYECSGEVAEWFMDKISQKTGSELNESKNPKNRVGLSESFIKSASRFI